MTRSISSLQILKTAAGIGFFLGFRHQPAHIGNHPGEANGRHAPAGSASNKMRRKKFQLTGMARAKGMAGADRNPTLPFFQRPEDRDRIGSRRDKFPTCVTATFATERVMSAISKRECWPLSTSSRILDERSITDSISTSLPVRGVTPCRLPPGCQLIHRAGFDQRFQILCGLVCFKSTRSQKSSKFLNPPPALRAATFASLTAPRANIFDRGEHPGADIRDVLFTPVFRPPLSPPGEGPRQARVRRRLQS